MSSNTTTAASSAPSTTPRAPYVAPTLEPLGSWSALTMQGGGSGGGFIDPTRIVRKVISSLD